jgi:hypothetical protein
MGSEGKMALAYESNLATGWDHAQEIEGVRRERQLEIAVVFTSIDLTARVMKEAGLIAHQIGAKITVIVPQVVPWPLQLSTPPILLDFHEAHFRAIANRTGVPTDVRIYLCRDRIPTVEKVIQHGTIVMIGARKRFWPTAERRLAWALRRRGHQVIVSELED